MAIAGVGGGSNPLSSLWIKPHYGPESEYDKQRRENSLAAKQEEQAKFRSQTDAHLNEVRGAAGDNPYLAAAKTQHMAQQGLTTSVMFEVQRTSQDNLEDMREQIELSLRESQAAQAQESGAKAEVGEPAEKIDEAGTAKAAADNGAATDETAAGQSIVKNGGREVDGPAAQSSFTYTNSGARSSSGAVYGKLNISV